MGPEGCCGLFPGLIGAESHLGANGTTPQSIPRVPRAAGTDFLFSGRKNAAAEIGECHMLPRCISISSITKKCARLGAAAHMAFVGTLSNYGSRHPKKHKHGTQQVQLIIKHVHQQKVHIACQRLITPSRKVICYC